MMGTAHRATTPGERPLARAHSFRLRDRRPFFLAGLWSRDPLGDGRGYTVVTCGPNKLVAALPHDRMPVILTEAGARAWLGASPLPADQLLALCVPYPAGDMTRTDQPRPAPRPRITQADLSRSDELRLDGA